jgi:tetratricopeptide (TPR) repeat protein
VGNDLPAALARVQQAHACEPSPGARGELAYIEGHARMWLGDNAEAESPLRSALELLPRGSARWFSALSDLCNVASCTEQEDVEREALGLAIGATPDGEAARAAQIACLSRAASGRLKAGDFETADALIARMQELVPSAGALETTAAAWLHHARAARGYYAGDVPVFQREIAAASRSFDAAGDVRNATTDRINLGYLHLSLGQYERAETELRRGFELAQRLGLASSAAYALHNLGLAVGHSGRLDEGIELERRAVELARPLGEPKLLGASHTYLSLLATERGNAEQAIEAARAALEVLAASPTLSAYAHAALAGALLISGDTAGALAEARSAQELLGSDQAPEEIEARVRLALARAAHASGDRDLAARTLREARDRLLARAGRIDDTDLRASFLERVPEHRATLDLAERWLA